MKCASLFAVAGIVAVGSAQSIPTLIGELPSCAPSCFKKIVPRFCDSATDYGCECSKVKELTPPIQRCILAACTIHEALDVKRIAAEICRAYSASASASTTAGGGSGSMVSVTSKDTTVGTGTPGASITSMRTGGGGSGGMPTAASNGPMSSSAAAGGTSTSPAAAPIATAGSFGAAVAAVAMALAL